MSQKTIGRRHFLKGLYSTAISLPVLDIMLNNNGTAFAATGDALIKKYVMLYGGTSLCNGLTNGSILVPAGYGKNYRPAAAMSPLVLRKLIDDVTIVSNLRIPYGRGKAGGHHPGTSWHSTGFFPLFIGKTNKDEFRTTGESPDVTYAKYMSKKIEGQESLSKALNYAVQASQYGTSSNYWEVSWNRSPRKQSADPLSLYNTITSQVSKPSDGNAQAAEKKRLYELSKRGTVLDLVMDDLQTFKNKLGSTDKQKLDQHLTQLRELEKEVRGLASQKIDISNSCQSATKPQNIPGKRGAYSGEDQRATLFVDLLTSALSCDLAYSASLLITYAQSFMNPFNIPLIRESYDIHKITHSGTAGAITKSIRWHIDIYARLLERMRSIQVGEGTLLNHCVTMLCFEGGAGNDYQTGKSGTTYPHSSENMSTLISGHMGGLKMGEHINGDREHPVKVFTSALKALGMPENRHKVGDIPGVLPKLFG